MGAPGKYHGQRLKAREVLRLYAAGERDFRGTILRGCNFRGADLSGANFSGADIRSAGFTDTKLRGTQFCFTKAGCQKRWLFIQLALLTTVSYLTGALHSLTGLLLAFLNPELGDNNLIPNGFLLSLAWALIALSVFVVCPIVFGKTAWKDGITDSLSFISFAYFGIVSIHFLLLLLKYAYDHDNETQSLKYFCIIFLIYLISFLAPLHMNFLIGEAFSNKLLFKASSLLFFVCLLCYFILCRIFEDPRESMTSQKSKSLFSLSNGEGMFDLLMLLVSMGGTCFDGADLTDANLTGCLLERTRLSSSKTRAIKVTRVRWKNCKGLDLSKLGEVIVRDVRCRRLLVRLDDGNKDFSVRDLTGANLAGARLHLVNFRGTNFTEATLESAELYEANLNRAILRNANLRETNLTATQCIGTDFTGADLTGATLEAWNIDSSTCLENVQCDYIYLLRDGQERRPNSGSFQPGEFTKLFQEVLDTIDLIFQNGIDWKAFTRTLQEVQVRHEEAELSVQSIANKGDGVVVVKLNAAPDTDKAAVHADFSALYQTALKEAEARYKAQLEAKDEQIADYRQQNANMQEVVKLLASRPVTIDVKAIAESKSMQGNDYSRNVNIRGDFSPTNSNVTLNLGEISGQVSNQISQLPDAPTRPDQPSLRADL